MSEQMSLDFDSQDPEQQLRAWWAANAEKERAFWTKERLCLSWMQGTTPDDSDMRWWESQPKYRRKNWLDLFDYEKQQTHRWNRPRRSFEKVSREWDQMCAEGEARDEAQIARYMEILKADFLAGRPCSISLVTADFSIRWKLEMCLTTALERLAIPAASLGLEVSAA